MKTSQKFLALCAAATLGACTTTGNIEKNSAIGAAGGAIAGAVIGNNVGKGDAKTGAIIGGIAGAAGGAAVGRQKDTSSGEGTALKKSADGQRMYFDQSKKRYYFVDEDTGRTYWQNGALRTN